MAATLVVNGQRIENVRLAVFDKDGTLIDVHTYWANMIRMRAEMIAGRLNLSEIDKRGIIDAMGVDLAAMRIKPEGPVGLKKREIVLDSGVQYLRAQGYDDQTTLFEEVFAAIDEQSLSRFDEIIAPLPGLFELFEALQAKGCAIAIATTDRTGRAALCMEHLGLGDSVAYIAGADAVTNPKPDPEIFYKCCEAVGVTAAEAVMVGDAPSDVNTGLAAKCAGSIGLVSGLTAREKLTVLTPLVVDDISHIIVE